MEHLVRPFIAVFSDVPDFRHAQGKRHALPMVLTLVTLAMLNQQNTLGQIAAWVHGLGGETRQRLHLRHNRVPSYATLRRVLLQVDTAALAQALQAWVEEVLKAYLSVFSGSWRPRASKPTIRCIQRIVETTVRCEGERVVLVPALQMLNAMIHSLGVLLQSQAIPARTNELGAIRSFLEKIVLTGRVVSFDALYTHPDLAQLIVDRNGHYLMRVKANQLHLLQALETWFQDTSPTRQPETGLYSTTVKGHGRLVQYTLRATEALNSYVQQEFHWPCVGQVFQIQRRCLNLSSGEVTTTLHYAITSLKAHQADPALLFRLWHQHWEVENKGHWVLDTVFAEDRSHARKAHLPVALSLMRKAVITLLRLLGPDGITRNRSRLSANVDGALSFVGVPLE
jgi:predicted transposase YbfD/YdcC